MNRPAWQSANPTSVKSFRVSCARTHAIDDLSQDSMRWSSMKSEATTSLANNLRYRSALPEGPGIELYEVKPKHTAVKMEEVVTRWVDDGFCRLDEILILSPHGTKAKTALAGHSNIGEWPLVGFGARKPGQLALLSINKAKGLDSLAVMMIDVEKFDKLSTAQEQMDYFIGASRARQLLAIFHRGTKGGEVR